MTRCVYSILWSDCLHVFPLFFHKGQMTICVSSNIPCGKGRDWMSLLLLQLCQNTMVCLCADCSANWHRLWQNKFWEPADSLHLLLSLQTLASTAPRHWSQLCQPSGRKYHFLDLILVRNLPVLLSSKSTFRMWLLYTDTTAGCDISTCIFFLLLYCHICNLGSSPHKHRNEINFAVCT